MTTAIKSTTRRIVIHNDLDIIVARLKSREVAREMGFSTIDQARISLATGELARLLANSVSGQGEIVVSGIQLEEHCGVQVVSVNDVAAGKNGAAGTVQGANGANGETNPAVSGVMALVDECRVENHGTRVTLMKWLS
jgi:serine/threonine-protein kinase RsbT